jgi:hypothetical protein
MPATKIPVLTLSVAAAALVAEYRAIGKDGNYAGAGLKAFGFATENAEAVGAQLPVDVLGTTIAEVGAAVADDASLEVGATGKLITATTGIVVAKAMQAAGADGDKIEVMILPK